MVALGLTLIRHPARMPVLAIGCLVMLTVLTFARQLFGHWTFPWDFLGPYTASPPFVAATVGTGHPLSWSPFVAGGFPVDVNPQAGFYFPLWWLLGALRIPLTLTVLTDVQVAHVCVGALGVLALARTRRLAWPWATVAAVAYLFFGGFYGESEHADIFRGFAYLPWLLWVLTPPPSGRAWTRLVLLPLLAWVIATGAYPGQLPAFGIIALVYLAIGVQQAGRERRRALLWPLAIAAAASAAVCLAVLLPFLLAQGRGDLVRVVPATAPVRAAGSFGVIDVLGGYLNSFAWHPDGSITSWALPVPVLIGLAFVTRDVLRRQLPLLAAGCVALTLAVTPKISLVGKAMVSLGVLFPSRFPAADYKPVVALAVVMISAQAWSERFSRRTNRDRAAVVVAGALLVGALLAPSTYARPTRALWLLLAVVLATIALAALRPRRKAVVLLLIGLIAVDGLREAHDYLSLGTASSWAVPPSAVTAYRARDAYVNRLPGLLFRAPATRPARVPPAIVNPRLYPTGTDPDAAGWVGDGYHETDYFSTIERVRWEATQNAVWSKLLLERWHAYLFPCPPVGCAPGRPHLPPASEWRPSTDVSTVSYGAGVIKYDVNLPRPAVMVENELAITGWHTNTGRARLIAGGTPFRTYLLSPGNYRFTAYYQEPGRSLQDSAVGVALILWSMLMILTGGYTRRWSALTRRRGWRTRR